MIDLAQYSAAQQSPSSKAAQDKAFANHLARVKALRDAP